jgi:hypothetical protein
LGQPAHFVHDLTTADVQADYSVLIPSFCSERCSHHFTVHLTQRIVFFVKVCSNCPMLHTG